MRLDRLKGYLRNWLSLAGLVILLGSVFAFILLFVLDLFAPHPLVRENPHLEEIELGYRQSIGMTIYGGTSEIRRSLIAEQALGMPRSRI